MHLMTSVALCTYNGARFLPEQLASIARQTQPPDEVVLSDDGSTDNTLALAHAFAAAAPFSVVVESNARQLGSTGNFAQAISRCRGEIIVLCDQDDVWHPQKIQLLTQVFGASPHLGLAFSNADMVDPQLRPLGYTLWDAIQFYPAEQRLFQAGRAFECLLRLYRVTGATMAFRSRFRDLVLPIADGWVHDAWIALLVAALADCRLIAEPLIQYRQHPGQQLGERRRGLVAQYQVARQMGAASFCALAQQYEKALERLRAWPGAPPERVRALQGKVKHCRVRAHMRDAGVWRLPLILQELGRGTYQRYSRGWKAVAQDLFLA